jgi:hypothetical protein
MPNQRDQWRQYEGDEYQRRERQPERDDRNRWPRREERGMGDYRSGEGQYRGREGQYRAGEGRESRGAVGRYEFENDAYGQSYWPAGYDDDRDHYGGPNEYYGREDEGYPFKYARQEYGRFRGVSRWHPRDPMQESRSDWASETGSIGSRGMGQSSEQFRGHRGKGPKGYTRSDERLKEIICERLMDDPRIDASDITVDVTGQRVTLTGTVESRLIKYQVEELVENCGVQDVTNNLRIRREGQQGSEAMTASGSQTGRASGRSESAASQSGSQSGSQSTGGDDTTNRRGY